MLDERLKGKVQELVTRFQSVEELLGDPSVLSDQGRYRELTQEHAYLGEIKELAEKIGKGERQSQENEELLKTETDPELAALVRRILRGFLPRLSVLKFNLKHF